MNQSLINNRPIKSVETTEIYKRSLKVGDEVRRKSDNQWYTIEEITKMPANGRRNDGSTALYFKGFFLYRDDAHIHFEHGNNEDMIIVKVPPRLDLT